MPAIFGQNSGDYQGTFRTVKSNTPGVTFNGSGLSLIQNLQVSHQQPIQNLFEVGSNKRYYVLGKASGTFSVSQILGFGPDVLNTVTTLADPCQGNRTLVITFPNSFCRASGGGGGSLTLTLKGVLLQSVGFTVASQDNLINSQAQGMMTDLEYQSNGLNAAAVGAAGGGAIGAGLGAIGGLFGA
jgi:hypothetical protein